MKKVLVSVVLTFVLAANAFAGNEVELFSKLNNKATFKSMTRYLGTDWEQNSSLRYVFSLTESKMEAAAKKNDEAAIEKVVNFNLANVKAVLSPEQYRKYLIVLNLTYQNASVVDLAEK